MDPDAAFDLMTAAFRAQDWHEAHDAARNLIRWMNRGGFPPSDQTRAEARLHAGLILIEAREEIGQARRRRHAR